MGFDPIWTKARIGDEIGFSEADLAALYGVELADLDEYLRSLEDEPDLIWQRIIEDADALRFGYRVYEVSDAHIETLRERMMGYRFGSPATAVMASGTIGWRLNPGDAREIARITAEVIGMAADHIPELAARLSRIVTWPGMSLPDNRRSLVDRVVDLTTYLVELTGVL